MAFCSCSQGESFAIPSDDEDVREESRCLGLIMNRENLPCEIEKRSISHLLSRSMIYDCFPSV